MDLSAINHVVMADDYLLLFRSGQTEVVFCDLILEELTYDNTLKYSPYLPVCGWFESHVYYLRDSEKVVLYGKVVKDSQQHLLCMNPKNMELVAPIQAGSIPLPRYAAASCCDHNTLYIFGGRVASQVTNDLYLMRLYGFQATWSKVAFDNGPAVRMNATLHRVGNKMLVFGGNNGQGQQVGLRVCNLRTGVWESEEGRKGGSKIRVIGQPPESRRTATFYDREKGIGFMERAFYIFWLKPL